MSCKPKTKSLRAANGVHLPVGMWRGGQLLSSRGSSAPDTSAFFRDPYSTRSEADKMRDSAENIASMQAAASMKIPDPPPIPSMPSAPSSGGGMGGSMGSGMPGASVGTANGMGALGGGSPLAGNPSGLMSSPTPTLPSTAGVMSQAQSQVRMADGGEASPYSIRGIGRSMGFFKSPGEQLRTGHGGDVPGTGTGDKIPAKYEPGEFVVSNDMLDAEPGLLGHLRGLRKAVLAAKGTTPEAADAKALGGRGLRAQ